MPLIVPPVPTPVTKCVTRPAVSRQISGPVVSVVRRRALRVGVLVGLPPAVDLPGQPVGDRVVRVRVLGRHRRRADDDLRAVRLEDVPLVLADLVRADEHAPVAALLRDEREAHPGVAGRRLDDRPARLQPAVRLRGLDHALGDPVLHRAARIEVLDLGQHQRGQPLGDPGQPDQRCVAHEVDHGVRVRHPVGVLELLARHALILSHPASRGPPTTPGTPGRRGPCAPRPARRAGSRRPRPPAPRRPRTPTGARARSRPRPR